MKFRFCYTNEDASIDSLFIADLFITAPEPVITDGPADNWYPGAPLEYEINNIYHSNDLIHPILDENLLDALSKEIERKYDSICEEWKKEEKECFDEDFD